MIPYFIWKGRSSDDFGVYLSTMPDIQRAAERVAHIVVPGRDGDLTVTERTDGVPTFDPVVRGLEISIPRNADLDAIQGWLQGSGELIVANEPDRRYFARILNSVTFRQQMRGSRPAYVASVQFYCQPLKGQYPAENDLTFTGSVGLYNPGNVPAKPLLLIQGTGTPTLSVLVSGTTRQSMAVPIPSGGQITVDCEAKIAYASAGSLYGIGNGFLTLPVGRCTLSCSGGNVTGITLTPRWRWC